MNEPIKSLDVESVISARRGRKAIVFRFGGMLNQISDVVC